MRRDPFAHDKRDEAVVVDDRAPHNHLHSFPTRRSSDLFSDVTRSAGLAGSTQRWGSGCSFVDKTRSEEHTSELQSRGDLVCRLLLEKKKEDTPTPLMMISQNRLAGPTRILMLPSAKDQ